MNLSAVDPVHLVDVCQMRIAYCSNFPAVIPLIHSSDLSSRYKAKAMINSKQDITDSPTCSWYIKSDSFLETFNYPLFLGPKNYKCKHTIFIFLTYTRSFSINIIIKGNRHTPRTYEAQMPPQQGCRVCHGVGIYTRRHCWQQSVQCPHTSQHCPHGGHTAACIAFQQTYGRPQCPCCVCHGAGQIMQSFYQDYHYQCSCMGHY